jgi:hypothetical protein
MGLALPLSAAALRRTLVLKFLFSTRTRLWFKFANFGQRLSKFDWFVRTNQ